jgi:hypothetical protein
MIPLIFKKEALDYLYDSVAPSIQKRISYILKNNQFIRNDEPVKLSDELRPHLCKLQDVDELSRIILCEPSKFRELIESYENKYPNSINREEANSDKSDYLLLLYVFNKYGYENKNFSKNRFIELLDIDTCPYCNRSYIYRLDKSKNVKPEIDHFYPKTIYPFLAASFYNLIPSCQTCNGFSGKGSRDTYKEKAVNPYLLNHDQFKFTYDLKSMSLFDPRITKGSIKVRFEKRIEENDDLFKLSELYEKHEDHVLELIIKSQLTYSQKYRDYLASYKGLSFSDSEIDRLITGNYTNLDELHKRPLSKLYRDIAIELGLIKE